MIKNRTPKACIVLPTDVTMINLIKKFIPLSNNFGDIHYYLSFLKSQDLYEHIKNF